MPTRIAPPDGDFAVTLNKGDAPPPGFTRGRTIVLGTAAVIVFFLGVNIVASVRNNAIARQERSEAVLVDTPSLVIRSWTATPTGIVERFVARNSDDVSAVRREAGRLLVKRRNLGDYGVRGQVVVPGRADLEQSLAQIEVRVRQLPMGTELIYASSDAELSSDLQKWGSFQQALVAP